MNNFKEGHWHSLFTHERKKRLHFFNSVSEKLPSTKVWPKYNIDGENNNEK